MTESNIEPSSRPAYDWDKALKTGKRDQMITLIREEFVSTLLHKKNFDSNIFTKKLDGYSSDFQETIKKEIQEYFVSRLRDRRTELNPQELKGIVRTSAEYILRASFEPLLETIIMKPHGKLSVNTFQLFKIFDSIAKIVS